MTIGALVRAHRRAILVTRISAIWLAALSAIMLAGCGSSPSRPSGATKPGGYYLDDGPGSNPPANLDAISDAVPKLEPINRSTSRPYTALGHAYRPYTELTPYKARGVASWYGKRYHGQKTSSGEIYDMYAMTAAHTVLPLPSYARVTNVANGKSVVVRINDRGPFHQDRLIDLSYLAAQRLDLLGTGSGMVEVEAIIPGLEPRPPVIVAAEPAGPERVGRSERNSSPESAVAAEPASTSERIPAPELGTPNAETSAGGFYVQLGAFSVAQNADDFLRKMRMDLDWLADSIRMDRVGTLYRVHAGPYAVRTEADRAADRVRKELNFKALVLER